MIGWAKRRAATTAPVAAEPVIAARPASEPGVYEISPALATVALPSSAAADAFHRIAHEVKERHLGDGRRGLALCGPSSGTGVTFTAANLAVALAQAGVATLLVEANMRNPTLDQIIRPRSASAGLQQVLRSELDPRDVVQEDVLPNLSLMFAGGASRDADQLVAGERFRAFIGASLRDYACTIVDTPPANRSADARSIAVAVGYAIIVGRRSFSFVDDTELLARQLAQDGVSVVGSILNGA